MAPHWRSTLFQPTPTAALGLPPTRFPSAAPALRCPPPPPIASHCSPTAPHGAHRIAETHGVELWPVFRRWIKCRDKRGWGREKGRGGPEEGGERGERAR